MSKITLAKRLNSAKPSATLAISAKANQLLAAGRPIINLSVGEPDFDTPDNIKAAAIAAIHAGFTKYTPVSGIIDLKKAICHKLKKDNFLEYQPEQIIVSTGLKQALFNLMFALLNEDDEVIIPAPYWVSYPEMVLLAEGKPVIVETSFEQHLKMTAEQLQKAITPKTKLLILNSPSNPSGLAYTTAELRALADVLLEHPQVFIASDDMYEKIYWGPENFVNIAHICPELFDRTIVLNGVSKTYAMTGWRIGYAAANAEIIKAMDLLQSQSTSNANSIAQKAALAAIDGPQEEVVKMCQAYQERHDFLYHALQQIPGVKVLPADGAFYSFPNMDDVIKRLGLKDDIQLCEYLLDKANLAVIPGSAFGSPNYIRISFATNIEQLKEALQRMQQLLG